MRQVSRLRTQVGPPQDDHSGSSADLAQPLLLLALLRAPPAAAAFLLLPQSPGTGESRLLALRTLAVAGTWSPGPQSLRGGKDFPAVSGRRPCRLSPEPPHHTTLLPSPSGQNLLPGALQSQTCLSLSR